MSGDEGPAYWNKFNDVSRDEMTEEQRLLYFLLRTYDKSSRPVIKASTPVVIRLGITLTQILDVVVLILISSFYLIYKSVFVTYVTPNFQKLLFIHFRMRKIKF